MISCYLTTVDCELESWEEWKACSVTCGAGTKRRIRAIIGMEEGDGKPCIDEKLRQTCTINELALTCRENCTMPTSCPGMLFYK